MKTWPKTPSLKEIEMPHSCTDCGKEIDEAVEEAEVEVEAERLVHEFGIEQAFRIAEHLLDQVEKDKSFSPSTVKLYQELKKKLGRKIYE